MAPRNSTKMVVTDNPGTRDSALLRRTIVTMVYIKTYIFDHFYQQYLVILTMVSRNINTKGHSYQRAFFHKFIFSTWYLLPGMFFMGIFQPSKFPRFFLPKYVKFNKPVFFLLLENFTNSDKTPPHLDAHLQLFPHIWKFWKKKALR